MGAEGAAEEALLDGEMAEMRARLAAGRRDMQRLAAQAAKTRRTLAAFGKLLRLFLLSDCMRHAAPLVLCNTLRP